MYFTYMIKDLNKIFPYPKARDNQLEIIDSIINKFNEGKNFVILEAPTGAGKSAIGYTIGRYFNKYYYITAQKMLQSQLSKDFGEDGRWCGNYPMVELKGRNAYKCIYYDNMSLDNITDAAKERIIKARSEYVDCSKGECKKRRKSFLKECKNFCPYYIQLNAASCSNSVLMNFHSFIYQTEFVPDRWESKDLLIIDEAHNTEQILMDYISITFSDISYDFDLPKYNNAEEYLLFFEDIELEDRFKEKLKKAIEKGDSDLEEHWSKQIIKYRRFKLSISKHEWVPSFEKKSTLMHGKKINYNFIELKPLFIRDFSHELLFDKTTKVLMMSATILDVNIMCDSLGIDKDDIYATRLNSNFPVKNRPIYFNSAGNMSYKNIRDTLPKMLNKIESICKDYNDHKGIIHTHNFNIANYILDNCSVHLRERLLFQNDFSDKDQMLNVHANSKNSIIIAPAMHEGLDLKNDLSRFQVICKVPYPGLNNNPQLKRRMELSNDYYQYLAALKLIQSIGRSVRSKKDWADTYILDECFKSFFNRSKKMFPQWLRESIIWN